MSRGDIVPKEQIIYGESIAYQCPQPSPEARFAIPGTLPSGNPGIWAIDEGLLSRHMLMLGAIGAGKSNAMYHFIQKLRSSMTSNDVMFIFDTKVTARAFHQALNFNKTVFI